MELVSNNYSATVDITTRCNLKCKHCRTEEINYDLSLDEVEQIAQKLAHPQRRIVFLTGGEPLVRNDIVQVVSIFKKYIPCVCINSNSLLLNEELLDALIKAGLNYIQVSLDGLRETHDYMRGVGNFDRAIEKLRLINTKKIKLHVSCCISMLNVDTMYDFAQELLVTNGIKVDILGFKRFIPKNEMAGKYNLGKYGLKRLYKNFEKVREHFSNITKIVVDFPQKNVFDLENVMKVMRKYHLTCSGCSAATGGPCIRPDGTVSPCSLLYINAGNIFENSLDEIYNSDPFVEICNRNIKGKCGSCKYRLICGGCRAAAMAIHNDYLAEDPECFL